MVGLKWEAVIPRLELHNLWDRDVDSKLAICETALIEVVLELMEQDGEKP